MTGLQFRGVEVEGALVDVDCLDSVITAVAPSLRRQEGYEAIHGAGGALLPGLHDHHLHLLALGAADASIDCSKLTGMEEMASLLITRAHSSVAAREWVRGVGYHESIAGVLDRYALDAMVSDRPVRIQHRSGALWMLNSIGLQLVTQALDDSADVERDPTGTPTGRLWRYDSRLRSALPPSVPSLRSVGEELSSYGITGVTDATPDLDLEAVSLLKGARDRGEFLQKVTILGAARGIILGTGFEHGPRKIMIRDHALPTVDQLSSLICEEHSTGRAVAVHCVSSEALTIALTAFDETGPLVGDRIEHASVVPPGFAQWIARLGLSVVTQPDFIRTRGDSYRCNVDEVEMPFLYPIRSLIDAGVRVAGSSDAPFGDLDPWQAIRSAACRMTTSGDVLRVDEGVRATVALDGYLSTSQDPGGPPRQVRVGAAADLCLLHVPLAEALRQPNHENVRLVVVDGRLSGSVSDP